MKKSTFKKIISIVLACTMIFSMFSICVSATNNDEYDYVVVYLDNSNLNNETLLAAISGLSALEKETCTVLCINDNPQITDLSEDVLKLLPQLREIDAKNCSISDLSFVSYFDSPNLNTPDDNKSDYKLSYLELQNNNIHDITPLRSLPYVIKHLDLSYNFITNVTPLYRTQFNVPDSLSYKYEHLNLDNNYISDARTLLKFSHVENRDPSDNSPVFHVKNNYITPDQLVDYNNVIFDFENQKAIPANPFVVGEITYTVKNEDTDEEELVNAYGIKGYYGGISVTDVAIPNQQLPITKHDNSGQLVNIEGIDFRAFKDNPIIEVVTIENNIKDIDEEVFSNCVNLRRIKLNNVITSIKDLTFNNCINLAGVCIPYSVINIGSNAFRNCKRLKAAEFSNPLTELHELAFHYCEPEIFEVYISSSITDEVLLREDSELLDDVYELKLTGFETTENHFNSIRRDFDIVNGLMSGTSYSGDMLKVPAGVDTINVSSYTTPATLESVVIPEGVTNIIKLPLDIDGREFKVLLPNTLENINEDETDVISFIDSTSSNNVGVYYKSTNTVASDYANSHNFIGITDFDISYDILNGYDKPVADVNVVIPQKLGVDIIGNFSFCSSQNEAVMDIETITLPDGISEIEDFAFRNCRALVELNLNDDGLLKKIGSYAISGCYVLPYIYIPNSVEEIKSFAFQNDVSLVTIQFGTGTQQSLTTLGVNIFEGCRSLNRTNPNVPNNFVFPESVTKIPEHAFWHCYHEATGVTGLVNITLPSEIYVVSKCPITAFEDLPKGINGINIICTEETGKNSLARALRERGEYKVNGIVATSNESASLQNYVMNSTCNFSYNNYNDLVSDIEINIEEYMFNLCMQAILNNQY